MRGRIAVAAVWLLLRASASCRVERGLAALATRGGGRDDDAEDKGIFADDDDADADYSDDAGADYSDDAGADDADDAPELKSGSSSKNVPAS